MLYFIDAPERTLGGKYIYPPTKQAPDDSEGKSLRLRRIMMIMLFFFTSHATSAVPRA